MVHKFCHLTGPLHTLYADLMEEKTLDLLDYHNENPEDEALYQQLGVQDESDFNKFISDTMFKIGRPRSKKFLTGLSTGAIVVLWRQ